jgi:hypothetical protein
LASVWNREPENEKKTPGTRIAGQLLKALGVLMLLPFMLNLSTTPAFSDSNSPVCGQVKGAARKAIDAYELYKQGKGHQETYDKLYEIWKNRKQMCKFGQVKAAGDLAGKLEDGLKALFRDINPSYLAAVGLGELLGQNVPIMLKRLRDTRHAINDSGGQAYDTEDQKKGALSFLRKSEVRSINNKIGEMKYLAGLLQEKGRLSANSRNQALNKISRLKKDINYVFTVTHGKKTLFLQNDWIGRWLIYGSYITKKKKIKKISGILDVANGNGGMWMAWTAKGKKPMKFPIKINGNIIRIDIDRITREKPPKKSSGSDILGLKKIMKVFYAAFRSLRITRQGEDCTMSVQTVGKNKNRRMQKIRLKCRRI